MNGVAIERQFGNRQVVATTYNAGIFYPLQAALIVASASTFAHIGVGKAFIFLAQLARNRLEALADAGFVDLWGIFYHIGFVVVDNGFLREEYAMQIIGFFEYFHSHWHAAYNAILQQQLVHALVHGLLYRNGLVEAKAQIVGLRFADAICPQPFFKIHRIHVDDLLISHRDRSFSVVGISTHSEQRPGAYHIVAAIGLEKLQCCACSGTLLYFIENEACVAGDEMCIGNECG